MTNDDLSRFYPQNSQPKDKDEFVRYGKQGQIISKYDAVNGDDVVNFRTLIKHAGGPGADLNYRQAWVSGTQYAQYDLVYVQDVDTRRFYMALKDIASSVISPDVDTDSWSLFLAVELPRQVTVLPTASEEYVNKVYQYVGEETGGLHFGYFYKCVANISSYTVTTETGTFYAKAKPALEEEENLYSDITCETQVMGKMLKHTASGYVVDTGSELVNTTSITENTVYEWLEQAVQNAQKPITGSTTKTLTTSGWDAQTKTQTVAMSVDTSKRNEIDVDIASILEWTECGVYATAESANGITFTCTTIPSTELTFRVVSMEVAYASE